MSCGRFGPMRKEIVPDIFSTLAGQPARNVEWTQAAGGRRVGRLIGHCR
jgi:hypothetical protein